MRNTMAYFKVSFKRFLTRKLVQHLRGPYYPNFPYGLEKSCFDVDIMHRNKFGDTALEIKCISALTTPKQVEFFIINSTDFNNYNPTNMVGYTGILFKVVMRRYWPDQFDLLLKKIINSSTLIKNNIEGKSLYHNIVSTVYSNETYIKRYGNLFSMLEKRGYDIDHQDKLGETAIHAAINFRNVDAVKGLLEAAIDVNICNACGETAFVDFDESSTNEEKEIAATVHAHMEKMLICGLRVSRKNRVRLNNTSLPVEYQKNIDEFRDLLKSTDKIKMGGNLTLKHLFSENDSSNNYPDLTLDEIDTIEKFLESDAVSDDRLKDHLSILKCKWKAIKRKHLTYPAYDAISLLTDCPSFPCLVSQLILDHVTYLDVNNVIEAARVH